MPTPREEDEIKGYLAELAGALATHDKERVAAIKAELARLGHKDKEQPEPETAAVEPVAEKAIVKQAAKPRKVS